jgi:outer membrane protein assembly factor BamB
VAAGANVQQPGLEPGLTARDLMGTWSGEASHEGEVSPVALEIEPGDEGKVVLKMTIPAIKIWRRPMARVAPQFLGNEVRLGPFTFEYDGKAKTLTGTIPEVLVPVYQVPVVLRRVDRLDTPPPSEPTAPLAEPVWSFDAGSPLWAGVTLARGVVYAGGEDGRLHAIDSRNGRRRWSFKAGGAIRSRPAVWSGAVFFQADDGYLYKVGITNGEVRWRVRVDEKPIERLPLDDPRTRYDRFASDVAIDGGRLYLGTHDGHVLALDASRGARVWDFTAGDSVLAAPTVDSRRVYFGSYDGHVYALDAAKGRLVWKYDTRRPVVSRPAIGCGLIVVGSRSYDLFGLDAGNGQLRWKRYFWFSWIESSATIRDGVAYVGSSDAAGAFAFDVCTGRRLWAADVYGWAWGQPAVTRRRVYIGTAGTAAYAAEHRGGILALARENGRPVWRFELPRAASGSYGFPGSPAVGGGFVFVTSLDGRVRAFAE